MALTPKQEKFCREVASGKDYTNAYLSAYDWNGSIPGAQVESTKLASRKDIQDRILALLRPQEIAIAKDSITARQKQIDFIQSRIEHCLQTEDEQSIIRYTDMLNKINALYKDTEQETTQESTVNDLDIKTLRLLTGTA